jgi:hypothetical protein
VKVYEGVDVQIHFLDLSTSWKLVVSYPPRLLYSPGSHWIGGWVNPRAGLDELEKIKLLILTGIEL